MSDVTMDQRLRLVQQVRARYHENQYDLSNRERILYGRSSVDPRQLQIASRQEAYGDSYREPYGDGYEMPYAPAPWSFSLKVRFFVAALLLTMVIVMDKNNMKVAGIAAEQIFGAISADYEEKLDAWAEAARSLPQN